ncbi:MAG: hypothetical protein H6883_11185 [Rhodobiaceae bacterium]|nr:hypothetical protein [Rhodobiaceae bacterium]
MRRVVISLISIVCLICIVAVAMVVHELVLRGTGSETAALSATLALTAGAAAALGILVRRARGERPR